jgi:hypothetical protein
VWEDGGAIAGFVCAHDVGFLGYLSALVVAEEARGGGGRVVRRVEDESAARGFAVLISDVWRGAEGFYRALGCTSPDVVLLRHKLPGEAEEAGADRQMRLRETHGIEWKTGEPSTQRG